MEDLPVQLVDETGTTPHVNGGPLRTAAAVAITTAAVTPLVVAAVVGMRALVQGATPLAGSVPGLMATVVVGGLLYWSPPALVVMGPLLVGAGWWWARH